jgi:YD repeat-containing protein
MGTSHTSATAQKVEATSRTYDGLDRLKTETRYDSKVVGYEYDPKGLLRSEASGDFEGFNVADYRAFWERYYSEGE